MDIEPLPVGNKRLYSQLDELGPVEQAAIVIPGSSSHSVFGGVDVLLQAACNMEARAQVTPAARWLGGAPPAQAGWQAARSAEPCRCGSVNWHSCLCGLQTAWPAATPVAEALVTAPWPVARTPADVGRSEVAADKQHRAESDDAQQRAAPHAINAINAIHLPRANANGDSLVEESWPQQGPHGGDPLHDDGGLVLPLPPPTDPPYPPMPCL